MGTAVSGNWNFTETLGTFLGCRVSRGFFVGPFDKGIHRFNDKEEDGSGYEDKRDKDIYKMAVHECTAVNGKCKSAKIWNFNHG